MNKNLQVFLFFISFLFSLTLVSAEPNYTIIINMTEQPTAGNQLLWATSSAAGYAGGAPYTSSDGTTFISGGSFDNNFRLYNSTDLMTSYTSEEANQFSISDGGNIALAQTITIPSINELSIVSLRLERSGTLSGNVNVYITETNSTGGADISNILYNGSIAASSISARDYYNFTINEFQTFSVTLESPDNDTNLISQNIEFNATLNSNEGLQNATLYIWNSTGDIFSQVTNEVTGTQNTTNWSVSNFNIDRYEWNVLGCKVENSITTCKYAESNRTFSYGISNAVSSIVSSVTETDFQYFNVTFNVSSGTPAANLWWNGTKFPGTGTNIAGNQWRFSKNFNIPTVSGSKETFWEINIGNLNLNTSSDTQTVNLLNMSLCGSPYTESFINFTFADEGNQSSLSAQIPSSNFVYYLGNGLVNKTFTYINSAENPSYSFCFTPSYETVFVKPRLQYSSNNYPQRVYNPDTLTLTNATTNQTLYLLSNIDGIPVTFQIVNTADQPISGVDVTASRTIDGSSVSVGKGTTGADGGVTFWLNSDFIHTFTFEKSGYNTFTDSFAPTQSSYTIQLGSGVVLNESDFSKGIIYNVRPTGSTLINHTLYAFNFTISSNYWAFDEFGFSLTNSSGYVFNTTSSTNQEGGTINVFLNTGNQTSIVMNYYWVVNGTYQNQTKVWIVLDESGKQFSLTQFLTDLSSYLNSGIFGLNDFGVGLIAFIIIFTGAGFLSSKFGLISPATISAFILGAVIFLDVGLQVVPNPVGAVEHFPSIFVAIITIGMIMRRVTR